MAAAVLLPEGLLWLGLCHHKDLMIILLLAIQCYCYAMVIREGNWRYFLPVIPCLLALIFFRAALFIPAVVFGVVSLLLARKRVVLFSIFGACFLSSFFLFYLWASPALFADIANRSLVIPVKRVLFDTSIGHDVNILTYNILDATSLSRDYAFMRPVMCLLLPFPLWRIPNRVFAFAIPSTVMLWFFLLFAVIQSARIVYTRKMEAVPIVLLFFFMFVSLIFVGPLISIRYRLIVFPSLALLGVQGYIQSTPFGRRILILFALLGVAVVHLVYMVVKGIC